MITDRLGSETNMKCPKCGSHDIRRSHFGGFWDVILRIRGKWPFRCRSCRFRFHQTAAAPPDA
jgi:predicted Zn-ribbon and HTH transcriptional regulator